MTNHEVMCKSIGHAAELLANCDFSSLGRGDFADRLVAFSQLLKMQQPYTYEIFIDGDAHLIYKPDALVKAEFILSELDEPSELIQVWHSTGNDGTPERHEYVVNDLALVDLSLSNVFLTK